MSLILVVLYIFKKIFVTFIDLPFNELSLVGLTLDPVDCPLSFSAMTLLVGSPGL